MRSLYQEIKNLMDSIGPTKTIRLIEKNDILRSKLYQATPYLDSCHGETKERLWYFLNNKEDLELCPFCGQKRRTFKNINAGLMSTCGSPDCLSKSKALGALSLKRNRKESQQKRRKTFEERYKGILAFNGRPIKQKEIKKKDRKSTPIFYDNVTLDEFINEIKNIFLDKSVYQSDGLIYIVNNPRIAIQYNQISSRNSYCNYPNESFKRKEELEKQGIRMITIWEDHWKIPIKKEIIISRLKSLLGKSEKIYARQCEIIELDGSSYRNFCNTNHLQGYTSSSIKIGLRYKDELVAVMGLGPLRKGISLNAQAKINEEEYELLRFCSKKGLEIVGGFSKLLSHLKKVGISHIKSYVDLDWSLINKSSYEKVGFKKIKVTQSGYYWILDGIRYNRVKFMKKKLVKDGYDPKKTEVQIMEERGAYRVYDCGNLLMEIEL